MTEHGMHGSPAVSGARPVTGAGLTRDCRRRSGTPSILLLSLALVTMGSSPPLASDNGLRSTDRAIAVVVSLHDPGSVAPQISITPGGLTTHSYFSLRERGFVIRDSSGSRVEATVSLAPSAARYRTREGWPVGTTEVTFSVAVRFRRTVYVVVSGELLPTEASVWEVERFGTCPAGESGRTQIFRDLTACLELFADAFDAANPTLTEDRR